MSVAEDRKYMARKIWGRFLNGWSQPHWKLTKQDEAIVAYWEKHGYIERDDDLMRLTEDGRAAMSQFASAGQG